MPALPGQVLVQSDVPDANQRPGMTLLELVAVMVIVSVTLALAAPSLQGFTAGRQVDHTARHMLALMQHARMQAISQSRPYRFYLGENDAGESACWLMMQGDAGYEPLGTEFGRQFTFPVGVQVGWLDAGRWFVEFDPTGRVTPATLLIEGRQDQRVWITADVPGEMFRITDQGVQP